MTDPAPTRPTIAVEIHLPVDVIAELQQMAAARGLVSADALMRLYVDQGLQEDLGELFYLRVLPVLAEVLSRYHYTTAEIEAILAELRQMARDVEQAR